ncbi:MAG: hypothetical protein AAF802_26845 [Planctomycetota bacterium]
MKTDLLRSFAIVLGLSVASGSAHWTSADKYKSPAKWSSFHAPAGSISDARRQELHPAAQEPVTPVSAQTFHQNQSGYPVSDIGAVYDSSVGTNVAVQATPRPSVPATRPSVPMATHQTSRPVAVAPGSVNGVSAAGYASHDCGCNHATQGHQSPYAAAAAAPWGGGVPVAPSMGCASGGCSGGVPIAAPSVQHVRPAPISGGYCGPTVSTSPGPISPWFGGAGLLFWNLDDGKNRPLITDDSGYPHVRFSDLNPDSDVGFEAHVGRYFGCGQYGVDFRYMRWAPGGVVRDVVDTGAGLRFTHPALRDASIDRGAGVTTIYDEYDLNATQIRTRRDVAIQGLEVNLVSFGLMGARRLGRCASTPILGHHPQSYGFFGGATGPLARACSGRVRIRTTHGFRWFRFEDSLEIIGDVDGIAGYQGSDLYYLNDVENNLYGYQFGSALTYCFGRKLFLNIGGKFGVYGNDVQNRHRITTQTNVAYTNSQGGGPGDLCCEDDDLVLAGLGELDLGVGYRLGNRLTFSGGYRVLGVSGVATAIGQMPNEYTTNVSATRVHANEGIILHGAYIGFDYNW